MERNPRWPWFVNSDRAWESYKRMTGIREASLQDEDEWIQAGGDLTFTEWCQAQRIR